jgi:hypothetical protein
MVSSGKPTISHEEFLQLRAEGVDTSILHNTLVDVEIDVLITYLSRRKAKGGPEDLIYPPAPSDPLRLTR